jgi:adenylate cyclase
MGATLSVVLGLICFDSIMPITETLRHKSYDLSFHLRPRTIPDEAVLVYLDDASYQEFNPDYGRWDRALHAKLLDRLTNEGAKVVVFDIIFSDANQEAPKADTAFEAAIERNGNVILGADVVNAGSSYEQKKAEMLVLPHEAFERAAASTGFVQFHQDTDFVVREHYHRNSMNPDITSMTWEAAMWAESPFLESPEGAVAEEAQQAWVNYYGEPRSLPSVSYSQAIAPDQLPEGFFQNKIILIGANIRTGEGIDRKDEFRNPFVDWEYVSQTDQFMPGVEVHATILLNLYRGDWLRRVPLYYQAILFTLSGVVFGIGIGRIRPLTAVPIALISMALVIVFSQWLFQQYRYWFPWLIIVVVQIPVAMFWSITFNAARLYVQRQLLRQSLNLYLSPRLVKAFLNRKDRNFLKPGADKQEVTILFSDIAGFTAATEGMDSDELARSMNVYFQSMVENGIHPQDGTVIKFIGDSIFALWNAPESQSDHALRACNAALELDQQPFEFRKHHPVKTRIGIHTGVANVGNFGSDKRVDYTAIGENINLASRIEGLNKYLKTNILISEHTKKKVGEELGAARYLGQFRLSGFEKTVGIYELMQPNHAFSIDQKLHQDFDEAVKKHDQRDMPSAISSFSSILEKCPGDGPCQFYLKRCQDIQSNPKDSSDPKQIVIAEK